MSDTARLGAVAGAVTETGIGDQGSESGGWPDRPEGAFKVGDRVITNCCPGSRFCKIVGRSGVVTATDKLARVWVRLDDREAFDEDTFLHQESLLPEPVPFSLTPEADAVLAEQGDWPDPWSTTPRETWELNVEAACTDLASAIISAVREALDA